MLPADAAHGKVDYLEVIGFSDHNSTAAVWYRLLNPGLRIPAGGGKRHDGQLCLAARPGRA